MITGSVGRGGVNVPADVQEIQILLDARMRAGLAVDGLCGPLTIAGIEDFQALVRGVTTPDGLISPGGPTYQALTTGPVPAGAVADTQPRFDGPTAMLVDLSHNNAVDPIDWGGLRLAGVGGVMLKASQGTGFTDPTLVRRLNGALDAGLLCGAYHFGTAENVTAQLDRFTGSVALAGADFSMIVAALDVEPNPSAMATNTVSLAQADEWVAGFRRRTGALPLIYGGSDYLGARGGAAGRAQLAACPLWIAQYPGNPIVRPAPLTGWMDWTLWQYTSGTGGCYAGAVGGLTSDRSIFRGSAAELATLWQQPRLTGAGGEV